ncbi:MAG: ROK family protein, partial [Mycobacterium sp.]|nr:ROK family protein [Mycobacterium sp.]
DALTDDNVPAALGRARDLMQDIGDRLDSPCLATAVGVAAPIDPRTSTIRAWPTSPFTAANAALGAALGIPDGRPVHVDNDVNWATLAEHRVGSMQQASDFLYIYLGAGVGAGLFLGGQVHRGHHGLAGEICFTRMENEETFMGRLARSPIGTHDGWGGSIDTARALELFNDPGAVTDLGPLVDDIARVIANIATAIDPSAIVVGGPLAEAAPLIEALGQRLQLPSLADVAITPTALGRDAPLCGAALGALELARRNRRR